MKVIFLTSSYPTKENISGPFIRNLALGLIDNNIEVTILTFSSSGNFFQWNDKGINVIEYPYSIITAPVLHRYNGLIPSVKKSIIAKLQFPFYFLVTRNYLKKFALHFDIVHAHWFLPAGIIAVSVKKQIKKPVLVTAWGAEFHLPKNPIINRILKDVNKKSDKIVAVSNYMKNKAKEYNLDVNSMVVIPNSILIDNFSIDRMELSKVTIAAVRRLVPEKRIQDLVDSVAMLPENLKSKINIWIVGDGPEKANLEKLVKERALGSIVSFLGMRPHEEIPKLLSKIDIYVNPSVQEGMATANLEAMCSGCVVIATKGYGNDEVITDGETGFLYEPKNIKQLSHLLSVLIDNKLLRREIGKNASLHIKTNFSNKEIAKKYIYEYDELIKRKIF